MTSIEFRAPWGRPLRIASGLSAVVLLAVAVSGVVTLGRAPLLASLLLICMPLAILLTALPFMVRGYTLNDDTIIVRRSGWATVLPLHDLQSVTGDADAMRGSLRLFANGGLFSFSGEFWNRKLGRYRALATDPGRAVVLRYPKRTVVITPHDPQQFIMRARTVLQTAGFPSHR
ncbi:PH domain-containing protein [Povalibacter sp.]|uniref:PH domain-containing protein n=1 Tax=Povalibacter sp. TaxID=1962978 RepID=UPI002F3FB4C2